MKKKSQVVFDTSDTVLIQPVGNGAVVQFSEGEQYVYKYGVEGLEGLVSMFYDLNDAVGETGSKHSVERLEIRVVHGAAYECKIKDCEICQN